MFRRLVIISIIVAPMAGTAAVAQGLRFGGQSLERLQQRLNLTDAQMNGIRTLQESRQREIESVRQEMQQQRQGLRQLLRQPNPNPNDVGNATLALRETRERMRDINQRFLTGVKGLLTPDQLQKIPGRLRRFPNTKKRN